MYLRSILPLSGILRVWVHFAVSLHSYLLPLPYAISSSKTVTVKRRKKLPLQRGKTCLFISLYSFQMSTRKTKALNRQEIFKIIKNFFQNIYQKYQHKYEMSEKNCNMWPTWDDIKENSGKRFHIHGGKQKPSWKGNRRLIYEESLNKSGIKVEAGVN